MTIDKAIEMLSVIKNWVGKVLDKDAKDAIELGIEALKLEKRRRVNTWGIIFNLLPGETEE